MTAAPTSLCIADAGRMLVLDYADAPAAHTGNSCFGFAVAFRMLQVAGEALSDRHPWDRAVLSVHSEHPGPGVRAAIEYVTRCISRGRFSTEGERSGCSRGMRFRWIIEDGLRAATVQLRNGFVSELFYELLDRRSATLHRDDDRRRLALLKQELAQALWRQPLAALFQINVRDIRVPTHA